MKIVSPHWAHRSVALHSADSRDLNESPVLLSPFRFTWPIGQHNLMSAFTVGIASYIAILEGLHV